ncbi:predicted protein [Nematostella vectensis]|uniref:Uncharacterized protein n=1 Tax=Nematostella vectensis TaxID=45351 RepID=A7SLP1_NEMVE|nr:predicted protein [Nematostella vectensis]|eukprot:XP_001627498.1 predicted protein [Nematostella vectensis]
MAMEMLSDIKETHNKPVTAVAYNPMKHEILIGCEDGVIKVWDYSAGEPGKLLRTVHEHDGWVTCFLFWAEAKLLFSAANDGTFIAWGSGGAVHDRISIGSPIYSMAWNTRRNQLVAAVGTTVQVFTLRDPGNIGDQLVVEVGGTVQVFPLRDPDNVGDQVVVAVDWGFQVNQDAGRESGHVIDPKGDVSREHTDLVKCVVCHESRVYSAGNDQRLIVYDSAFSYHGKNTLAVVSRIISKFLVG